MKTNIKTAIIKVLIGVLIFSVSCTEDITLPLDNTYARLVVDGSITTDTIAHKVLLSRSGDALNKEPIMAVSKAYVIIYSESDTFKLTENPAVKGEYLTQPNVFGLIGRTYNLFIDSVDVNDDGVFEKYTAKSFIKKINPIDSTGLIYQQFNPRYGGWLVLLWGWDVGGRNYYLTKASFHGKLITDSIEEYGFTSNAGFDGGYYDGLSVYFLRNNKPDEVVKIGDTVSLELNSVTEEYCYFVDGFKQELQAKTPLFSGPSANVLTNIEPKDMAVGYFSAYSIMRSMAICKGDTFKLP